MQATLSLSLSFGSCRSVLSERLNSMPCQLRTRPPGHTFTPDSYSICNIDSSKSTRGVCDTCIDGGSASTSSCLPSSFFLPDASGQGTLLFSVDWLLPSVVVFEHFLIRRPTESCSSSLFLQILFHPYSYAPFLFLVLSWWSPHW